jgi:hypothetical protein
VTSPGTGQRQGGASIVMYRMGGREYPLRVAPNCKVCRSPHRFNIEQEIIAGRTYKTIEMALPDDADLSSANIRAHYTNGHLPLDAEVSRRLLDARAAARGLDIERTADSLVDGAALAEITIQKTYEAVARGEVKPTLAEALNAAKFLEVFAPSGGGLDEALLVEAFMVYQEEASKVMTGQQFEDFGRRLGANPTLQRLMAQERERREGVVLEDETPRVLDNGGEDEIELSPSANTEPQEGTA